MQALRGRRGPAFTPGPREQPLQPLSPGGSPGGSTVPRRVTRPVQGRFNSGWRLIGSLH